MSSNNTQSFYSHGKLLLSSEYFVLDGALALALPTKYGQSLEVSYKKSYDTYLYWTSVNVDGETWFDVKLDLWNFDLKDGELTKEIEILQTLLRTVRKLNSHFLREENNMINVKTNLEFPLNWGLGSSSTLIYNIAQWAHVSPFELLKKTFGGSGYDIACAQSEGPILYEVSDCGPKWSSINFEPEFKDNLYFVYLGKKQNSRAALEYYEDNSNFDNLSKLKEQFSVITQSLISAQSLQEFESLIDRHEDIIADTLNMPKVKKRFFSDFWGTVKSLGAWGGDFVLLTSNKGFRETKTYFSNKGFDTFVKFEDMILDSGKIQ